MTGLEVQALEVEFHTDAGVVRAVRGVSFSLDPGLRLGLVGESGSGKTTTALSLMRMIRPPGRIAGGRAILAGTDLFALSDDAIRRARLSLVSYIPQGAMNSLNPVYRIEEQFFDAIVDHEGPQSRAALRERVAAALDSVDLPARVTRLYPHELSGGMKQRVCIAIGIILRPKLIIADEPTSALDVVTQRQVMETLTRVQRDIGCSMILIGHDMGLMAQAVDDLMVMRDGRVLERGPVRRVFKRPAEPYTRTLIESVPSLDNRGEPVVLRAPLGRNRPPLLAFEGAWKAYGGGLFQPRTTALHPVSLTIDAERPSILAVVGQSGSGKTTLGQLALGLAAPSGGRVAFDGRDLTALDRAGRRSFRREVQAVFQDPYSSFNPFYKVDHGFVVPLRAFKIASRADEIRALMEEACEQVGLHPRVILGRFPHELSGGQRQRLMVARALMLRPRLIVADEPVSMVDASLRASILKNLKALKDAHGISVIYITHDLATAYHVSDYVVVLQRGRVVEAGDAQSVIKDPRHPYTRLLIDSIPWPDPDRPWADAATLEADLQRLAESEGAAPVIRAEVEGVRLVA